MAGFTGHACQMKDVKDQVLMTETLAEFYVQIPFRWGLGRLSYQRHLELWKNLMRKITFIQNPYSAGALYNFLPAINEKILLSSRSANNCKCLGSWGNNVF